MDKTFLLVYKQIFNSTNSVNSRPPSPEPTFIQTTSSSKSSSSNFIQI